MKLTKKQTEAKKRCLGALHAAAGETRDRERAHTEAEEALVTFLGALGLCDVVDAYRRVPTW